MKWCTRKRSSRVRRRLAAACVGAAAGITAGLTVSSARAAEVIYDLRLAGGGKSVSVTTASPLVNLELFALVADPDLNPDNTGFNSAQGAWTSGIGGMLGNFSTSLISPFNDGSGSQNPSPSDLDGDGDLDVGANPSSTSGFWIASAGGSGSFTNNGTESILGTTYRLFKIGTGTFTATSFSGAGTSLNFVPRTGDGLVHPHKYFLDSTSTLTSINGNDPRLSIAAPVTISLSGAGYTWTRGGGTNAWDTPTNWGSSGFPNSVLDTATFGETGAGTVDLHGNRTVGSLTFTNNPTPYVISNGGVASSLTLSDSSGIGNISLNNNGTVTIASAAPISASTLNLGVNGQSVLTVNSVITSTQINKSGAGTLQLGGANTSLGPIAISAGTLQLSANQAIPGLTSNPSAITIAAGATLDLNGFTDSVGLVSGAGAVALGSGGSLDTGKDDHSGTLSGVISGSGRFAYVGSGLLTVSGNNTLSGSLAVSGGTIQVASANNIGTATIEVGGGGTLRTTGTFSTANGLSKVGLGDGYLDVAGGTTLTSSGSLTYGAGAAASLVKAGAGTLTLSGTPGTSYSGPLRIDAGTVSLTGTRQIGSGVSVTIGSGTAMDLSGSSAAQTFAELSGGGNLTVGSAGLSVGGAATNTTFSGQMSGAGGLTLTGGGLTLTGTSSIGGGLTVSGGTHSIVGAASLTVASTSYDGTAGPGYVGTFGATLNSNSGYLRSTTGSATLTLSDAGTKMNVTNDFSVGAQTNGGNPGGGLLTVNGGSTITVGGTLKVWSPGGQAILNGGTITAGTLDTNGNPSHFVWTAGTVTLTSGDADVDSAGALGSNVTLGAGQALNLTSAAQTLRVGTTGAASLSLSGGTLSDAGAMRLGLAPGVNGSVTVNSGSTLTVSNSLTVGDTGTGSLQVNSGGLVNAGSLPIGATAGSTGMVTISSGASVSVTGDVSVGGTSAAAGGNGTISVSGSLDAGGTLKVWGAGTTTFTVTGGGIASAATLDLAGGNNSVSPGGVLNIGAGGMISNGGDILLVADSASPAVLQIGGNFTYTGGSDTAAIMSDGSVPGTILGTLDLRGATRTFNIANGAQTDDMFISARIINGGISKIGQGTLTLTGVNDYGGTTFISQGQITAGAGALPAATAVTVGSGAVLNLTGDNTIASLNSIGAPGQLLLNGFSLSLGGAGVGNTSFSGVIVGGGTGSLVKSGTGMFTIFGSVTGTNLTVNQGSLRFFAPQPSLSGVITVNGFGPIFGTLTLIGDHLGNASVNLNGGHLQFENGMTFTRPTGIDVRGGFIDVSAPGSTVDINALVSGVGNLTKIGPGTLGFLSANTYSGGTTISVGTLATRVSNAIPANSEVTIAGGAILDLNSNSSSIGSLAGAGNITLGSATITVGGNDATTSFTGQISGNGSTGLVKQGLGTLTLGGAINYNGATTVNAGTLQITGSNNSFGPLMVNTGGTLSVSAGSQLGAAVSPVVLSGGTLAVTGSFAANNPVSVSTFGGTIDVAALQTFTGQGGFSGNTPLNKAGAGTLALNSSQSLAGIITVDSGRLVLNSSGTLTLVPLFNVNNGATLELDNSNGNVGDRINADVNLNGGIFRFTGAPAALSSEVANQLHLIGGESSVVLQNGASGGTTAVTFSGLVFHPGGTLAVTAANPTANSLVFNAQPGGFMGGAVTLNGVDFATYNPGAGVAAVPFYASSIANGFNCKLTASGNAPPGSTPLSVSLDTSGTSVTLSQGGGSMSITSGGLLKFGANPATITGGNVDANAAGNLYVTTGGSGDLTIASELRGNMNLVKGGSGALVLTSNTPNHNFTGGIFLNAGTLRISNNLNLGNGAGTANSLIFNGGTLQATTSLTIGATRTLTFQGNGGTLSVTNGTLTLGTTNQLAGAGPLIKSGTGILRIATDNTYSGAVTVSAGTLRLDSKGSLGSAGAKSLITLGPSSTLDLRSDGPYPAAFGNGIVVQDNSPATAANINTSRLTAGAGGVFQLGGLRMGNAALNTGGADGSLEFTGIVTLTGAATLNTSRNLTLSDRITGGGSLTKSGTGSLTFGAGPTDIKANTYTGLTTISGGTLVLNKAAGTTAIAGDIALSGGTLTLLQPKQLSDNSALTVTGGTFDVGGQSEAVTNLTNTSGNVFVTNAGTLTVNTTTLNGGTTIIGAPPGPPVPPPPGGGGGNLSSGPVEPPNDVVVGASTYTTVTLNVSDGTTTVNPTGQLNIGAGGLFFTGSLNPTITLVADLATPGKMTLTGDVTNNCSSGTASVLNSGAIPIAGTIELGDATRTFTVSAASDLFVGGKVSKGGVRKSGNGKLILNTAGDYALGTNIVDGILEARADGALGSGAITLGGGNLNLRSNSTTAGFANDVIDNSDATIDIGRQDAAPAGTFQLKNLTIGASRLKFMGANGGTAEFTGASTISAAATIENYVTVKFSNTLSGAGSLTKDLGAGTLILAGSAANTFTGTTRVNAGVLQLNKPAAVNALASTSVSVFTGGVVRWMANDQIPDSTTLNINGSSSQMDLNGFSDTIAAVSMTGGTLATGAGTLRLAGNVTTAVSTVSANITGKLDLGAATRTFTVADGATVANDLVVSADISGTSGISKAGSGTLMLSGNNTFTGGVTVTAGAVTGTGLTTLSSAIPLNVAGGSLDLPGALTTMPATVITKTGAANLTISGTQTHGSGSQLLVQGGVANLNTDAGSASSRTLSINATSGSVNFNASQHLTSLTVGSGVTAALGAGNRVLFLDSLTTTGTGKVNLSDGDLILTTGLVGAWNGSNYTGITGQLAAGRNGGGWSGNGIVTTQSNATSGNFTTLAVASAAQVKGIAATATAVWAGQTVTGSNTLVSYTYGGDANMDGKVNVDDYGRIDFNVAIGTTGWYNGDFNYDGKINVDDYGIIDFNISIQGAPLGGAAGIVAPALGAGSLPSVSAVPEPALLAPSMLIGAGALLKRRRRTN